MLRITPAQVEAMTIALRARWRDEIANTLAARYPVQAERLGRVSMLEVVGRMITGIQAIGGETFDDFATIVTALFVAGEVSRDDKALAELTAMLTAEEAFPAKLVLINLCLPTLIT